MLDFLPVPVVPSVPERRMPRNPQTGATKTDPIPEVSCNSPLIKLYCLKRIYRFDVVKAYFAVLARYVRYAGDVLHVRVSMSAS
jgi:hypothetical protein